jgi:hypothetical protein
MRIAAVSAMIGFLALSVCEAKRPNCTFRAHTEASSSNGPVFSTQIRSLVSGKTVVIEKMAALSERDVVAFRVYPAAHGSYGALWQLNDHGRLTLDSLSIERRGTFLFIFVNGRPLSELQIDRRVSDGRIYIASGLTSNEIELMRKDWPLINARKK